MAENDNSKKELVPDEKLAQPPAQQPDNEETQYELFAFREMMSAERLRIDAMNRRTDMAVEAIQMSDTSDKRQFDYRMEQLHVEEGSGVRRDNLVRLIFIGGGSVVVVFMALIFWMAFFGLPEQSVNAIEVLRVLGIGLGGGGILFLITRGFRFLTQP